MHIIFNNKKQYKMESKKKEIESKLETLKKGLTNPQLKTNPALKKSLEKKIFDLEDELEKLNPAKVAPAAKAKEPTITKAPAAKKESGKKPKLEKLGGFKFGEKVSFVDRTTGATKKGEIIKFNIHKGNNFSLIKTKDGEQWVSIKKLEK
jgi:hypothetical protein